MKSNEKYTDNSIEPIPYGWRTAKLKHAVQFRSEKVKYIGQQYIGLENVESGSGKLILSESQEVEGTSTAFQKEDVLFAKLRPYLAKCIIPEFSGICSSEFLVLRDFAGCNRFLKYWFLSANVIDSINASTYGAKMPRANWTYIGEMKMSLPPAEKQYSIADYLDRKTAVIDSVIADKQKLIELLQEKRTAVICQAVTKGLDRNAPMRDSGIAWLGDIPEHWDVVPAKALFSQSKETRHTDDAQLTASQKYGIISQEDYMTAENSKIVLADKGLENWKHVEPNDFIISLRSFQGGLEMSYIAGCITWHYIILKPQQWVNPEYFKWLFKSTRYIEALQRTANFIRDGQDLRFSNFVQVPLPHIPLDEQREIAEYLNRKTASIDRLIADVAAQIEKFKEYRQSVISEAVTGKVAIEYAN